MHCRRVCILLGLLLCLSACLTTEASTVCAVLPALRSEVERNLADRLETELSKEDNLVLVNRAELQAIAEEQLLSQVFGKDSPQLLRKISKSFRADLLVILTHTVSGDEEFIRVLYAESTYGCRLLQELLPYSGKNADDLVRHIVSSFREVRARYADGTKWIIAVPPFVSRNLVQDYHELRARFSHIVESALSLFPGTAVLAFEEAQAIQNEQALAGGDSVGRILPIFVEGEYRVTEAGDHKGTVALNVRITSGSRQQSLEVTLPSVEDTVRYLSHELPAQIMQIPDEDFLRSLSIDKQVAMLAERADMFALRSEYLNATALREAALLIAPMNVDQRFILATECFAMTPFADSIKWSAFQAEEVNEGLRQRCAAWRRGVEHFTFLIRNRLIGLGAACKLLFDMKSSISKFSFFVPNPFKDNNYLERNPSVKDTILNQYSLCNQTGDTFIRDTLPILNDLDTRLPADNSRMDLRYRNVGGIIKLRHDLYEELLDSVPARYINITANVDRNECDAKWLDHYYYLLNVAIPDLPILYFSIHNLIYDVTFRPEGNTRLFTKEEYIQFLKRLSSSDRRMSQYYGQLGLMLYKYKYGCDGEVLDQQSAQRIYRDILNFLPNELASLRKNGDSRIWESLGIRPIRNTIIKPDPVRNLYSRKYHLCFQSLRMQVRTHNNELIPLSKLAWANQDGYSSPFYDTFNIVPAGPCDIFWNSESLLLYNGTSVLRELFHERTGLERGITDVRYDGRYIWAAHAPNGIYVYSDSGALLAHANQESGIPQSKDGIKFYTTSPGQAVAVGSIPYPDRSWFANLTLNGDLIGVDVFHESLLSNDAVLSRGHDGSDPRVGFVPLNISKPMDTSGHGNNILYLSCGYVRGISDPKCTHVLMIDMDSRKVTKADPIYVTHINPHTYMWHELVNGDRIIVHDAYIDYWISPSNRLNNCPSSRVIFSNPYMLGLNSYIHGDPLIWDNYVFVPGRCWLRIDPRTKEVEEVDKYSSDLPAYGKVSYTNNLGMVMSTLTGHILKVFFLPNDISITNISCYLPQKTIDDPPQVQALRPVVEAVHRFRNSTSLWPLCLRELVPEYTNMTLLDTIEYKMIDDNQYMLSVNSFTSARNIFGAHRVERYAYICGGYDQGWYRGSADKWSILDVDHSIPVGPNYFAAEHTRRAVTILDHRITAQPNEESMHRQKYKYLLQRHLYHEARDAAVVWIKACPRSVDARASLIDIERKLRSGLDPHEASMDWDNSVDTYASWILFMNAYNFWYFHRIPYDGEHRSRSLLSVSDALSLPLAKNDIDIYIAEGGLAKLTGVCDDQQRAEWVVKVCNIWEKESRSWSTRTNRDYLSYRAIARLRLSEYDAANDDVQAAIKAEREEGFISPIDLNALRNAIKAHDVDYKIEYKVSQEDKTMKGRNN